jgi:hypothetical protein
MHDLTLASQAAYMRLQKGRGRHRYSPRHTTRNEGGEALRRLLLLVGLTMLGALLFASVALAQDYSSATATATASSTAIASAASAAGGSLPATGGPASPPLLGLGALMLVAGGGIVSSRIVRRSS